MVPPTPPAMIPPQMRMLPGQFNPFPPSAPKRPRRSAWFIVLLIFLIVALAVSVVANLGLLLARGGFAVAKSARQVPLVDGDTHQTIAVIPVEGVIGNASAEKLDHFLKQAEQDSEVKAIVLRVDTPGGSVAPSDEMYHRIKDFHAKTNKPVVISMGGLATSGGYYISCAAQFIVAEPTTWTGNIGVLMPHFDLSDLVQKWGIKEDTTTAPEHGFKDAGSMFRPALPEEKAYFQDLVDHAYKNFTDAVQDGRKDLLTRPIAQIANGKAYAADEALSLGLVDKIGYLEDAWNLAAALAKLQKPRIVKYQEQVNIFDMLFDGDNSNFLPGHSQSRGGTMTVNGVNINLDAHTIQDLRTPRPMYLWQD